MSGSRKIGYLGGTFDPPHLGHEILAREALIQLGLDQVLWLITPDPPHKTDKEITAITSRMEMVELVTEKQAEFEISQVDLMRPSPHYAADTVEIIKDANPELALVYIIGEDSLGDLPEWYEPDRFLDAIDLLAVAPRPGYESDLDSLDKKLAGLRSKTTFLKEIMIEISSSLIRERIRSGEGYDHFLADEVADYIQNNDIYQG